MKKAALMSCFFLRIHSGNYVPGILNPLKLTPKKLSISVNIAHAANTITSPTKPAVIRFLAASVFPLSPPDVIQLIPPRTNMKKKATDAIIRTNDIAKPTKSPKLMLLRFENSAGGCKFICD